MKRTIELDEEDAAIIFREDDSLEFSLYEDKPYDSNVTENILIALIIFSLLQDDNEEFGNFILNEKKKIIKKYKNYNYEKPISIC